MGLKFVVLESKYALEMRQYGVDAPASNIEGEA
jgi:hypothetical protein